MAAYATQRSLLFGKWRFREKEVRRMGQKQRETERGVGEGERGSGGGGVAVSSFLFFNVS